MRGEKNRTSRTKVKEYRGEEVEERTLNCIKQVGEAKQMSQRQEVEKTVKWVEEKEKVKAMKIMELRSGRINVKEDLTPKMKI